MIKKKHYVTFTSPGTFLPESTRKEIGNWDIKRAIELSKGIKERYNATPYCFQFSTIVTADSIRVEGVPGELKVEEKEIDSSGTYFLGGRLRLYHEIVKENIKGEEIIRYNMETNKLWIIVENTNSYRFTEEFKEEDFIIDDEGNIIRKGTDEDLMNYRSQMEKENESK